MTAAWRRHPIGIPPRDRRATAVWDHCPLTERQLQVLQRVAEGLSWEDIGLELGMTRGTAIEHAQKVRKRLGLGGKMRATLLVAIAMREGWIQ